MTTDNTPLNADDELREILDPEFLDYAGAKEEHFYPALNRWCKKQIEAVLDRLEARLTEEASGIRQINTDYAYGFTAANDQTNEAIEAERNKLKESTDE